MLNSIDVLLNCPLFEGKNTNDIKNILSSINYTVKHFKKNELILQKNVKKIPLSIVLKGSVEIQNNLKCGKCINIFYKSKGELFGGGLVFIDELSSNFDVIAKEPCSILQIQKQSIETVFLKDHILSKNIITLLSKELLKLNKKIELFSIFSIQEKVAYSLIHYIENNHSLTITLPYSKTAWAEHLNVSRSSLSRELKILESKKILFINNKTIEILNLDKLEKILGNF